MDFGVTKELLLEFKEPLEDVLRTVNKLIELINKEENGEDVEDRILQETGRLVLMICKNTSKTKID